MDLLSCKEAAAATAISANIPFRTQWNSTQEKGID